MPRNERFSSDYQFRIQNLIQAIYPHLYQKQDDVLADAKTANHSLATFVKVCLSSWAMIFVLVIKQFRNLTQ